MSRKWTPEEEALLLRVHLSSPFNYGRMKEHLPGRSHNSLYRKLRSLGYRQDYNQRLRNESDLEHQSVGIYGDFFEEFRRGANVRKSENRKAKEFSITIEYVVELFQQQGGKCYLSGLPITLPLTRRQYKNREHTASLDRIDSSKGYVEGNVAWAHKEVNMLKGPLPNEVFVYWAKKVAEHHQ